MLRSEPVTHLVRTLKIARGKANRGQPNSFERAQRSKESQNSRRVQLCPSVFAFHFFFYFFPLGLQGGRRHDVFNSSCSHRKPDRSPESRISFCRVHYFGGHAKRNRGMVANV